MNRTCRNCKYENLDEYVNHCKTCYIFKNWEPKEEAKLQELEEKVEKQERLILELEEKVEEQERLIRELERMNVQKDGEIRGLKFAIRCNGVSGGEVR